MASKRFFMRLNTEKHADVIKRLESEKNMSAFVVDCVRAQIFAESFAEHIFKQMIVDDEKEGAEDGGEKEIFENQL